MGFFKKVGSWLRSTTGRVVAAFAVTSAALTVSAQEQSVTIPDTGVDMAGYATAAITYLGGIIAVVIGGVIAFILIRAAIRWIRGMK